MALTTSPLTMTDAAKAFSRLDTSQQVRILREAGQTHASDELLDRLRALNVDVWSALMSALESAGAFAGYVNDRRGLVATAA